MTAISVRGSAAPDELVALLAVLAARATPGGQPATWRARRQAIVTHQRRQACDSSGPTTHRRPIR